MLAEIKSTLGMKTKASKASKLTYSFVVDNADLFSYEAKYAIYGIQWALQTGRLSYHAEYAVLHMNALQYAELVAEIAEKDLLQNQVPAHLNSKFTA